MQRSRESIGAIAGALAKAQIELRRDQPMRIIACVIQERRSASVGADRANAPR
jgi:hypothetical protein